MLKGALRKAETILLAMLEEDGECIPVPPTSATFTVVIFQSSRPQWTTTTAFCVSGRTMLGHAMHAEGTCATSTSDGHQSSLRYNAVGGMDSSNILVAGVGGIGCSWARQAHTKCRGSAHLVLIDADDAVSTGDDVHVLRLRHAFQRGLCRSPTAG